ncbi:hypothetical protein SAY86_018317 [Trapa natans]|uniref:Uncharacterized protein n=1 Tax=Trapa natans TaxID=22666 RepID=A0AAN7QXY0_TRANT|nr:hypothetical protein SAY86_018317 [Trapa natans]
MGSSQLTHGHVSRPKADRTLRLSPLMPRAQCRRAIADDDARIIFPTAETPSKTAEIGEEESAHPEPARTTTVLAKYLTADTYPYAPLVGRLSI